ncbi:hypothetical protein JVT61DRAFT_14067 [Boletus reticuloceps]|uniref:Mtf2-like C-terminal domain-containing protein n=1 Tax=Boletus reticuloceps TaxID=495285 RepID=A0A8I2YVC5_9AGAM|nr:hypothetical protein JVT61DRAFT_14067 [Boletus reticuloceps]
MLASRALSRRVAAFSFFSSISARTTSTSPATASTSQPEVKSQVQDSIFTAPESPWDHVFSDIDPVPPLTTAASTSGRKKGHGQSQSIIQRSSGVRHQRASITAREMSVFDEMFDMIFNAVSAQKGKAPASASSGMGSTPSSAQAVSSPIHSDTPSLSGQTQSIGRDGTQLNDLFRTLRRHTSRVRWTSAIDEELDRKKETMELFNTDYDLLQWVTQELFGEAQQWDEETKRAMAASNTGATTVAHKGKDTAASPSSSLATGPGKHSIYPHLIAHAMRVFRTTYSNPSLSLAIFNHAARMSIPSYVFGCTAPAYNELIEAKWEGWGDLEGVCSAVEEMRANGIKSDGRTRILMEKVRREVGEARPVELGEGTDDANDVNLLARRVWEQLGEVEVMRLLHRIERLALRDRTRRSVSSPHEESWKSAVLQPAGDDGWSFDGWDKTGDAKKQRWQAKPPPQDSHSRTLNDWTVLDTPKDGLAFR